MIATNRTNHLLILTKARQPKYTLLPSNVCTSSTKLACRDAKSSVCKYVVLSSAMLLDEAELTEQTRCVSTPSKSPQQAAYWLKGSRTCLQTSDTSRSSFIACCCDVLSKQFFHNAASVIQRGLTLSESKRQLISFGGFCRDDQKHVPKPLSV